MRAANVRANAKASVAGEAASQGLRLPRGAPLQGQASAERCHAPHLQRPGGALPVFHVFARSFVQRPGGACPPAAPPE
eukprot:5115211-Pyramimonas_sp.AAC.1